jgi:hypothetical protein
VGAFKFATKSKSYTNEVVTGSTKDCGVIGVMIVEEKVKKDPYAELLKKMEAMDDKIDRKSQPYPVYIPYEPYPYRYWHGSPYYWGTTYCGTTAAIGDNTPVTTDSIGGVAYSGYASTLTSNTTGEKPRGETLSFSCCAAGGSGGTKSASNYMAQVSNRASKSAAEPAEFDLGSTWGQRLLDKVDTVEFERGAIIETLVIYYASREVLQAMGVPLTVQKAISFPDAFPNRYCTPPKRISE